jgi:hypothetical protein
VNERGTRLRELRRRLRSTAGRGRKLRGLLALLRPYRWRVAAMFASLILATAAALAPPPLATLAIDNGIIPRDVDTLNLVVVGRGRDRPRLGPQQEGRRAGGRRAGARDAGGGAGGKCT